MRYYINYNDVDITDHILGTFYHAFQRAQAFNIVILKHLGLKLKLLKGFLQIEEGIL